MPTHCAHCRREFDVEVTYAHARGLCWGCYLAWRRTGQLPDLAAREARRARGQQRCVNCGRDRMGLGAYQRCGTCATYWQRHGVDRPWGRQREPDLRRAASDARPCQNCGGLRRRGSRPWTATLCRLCYLYQRDTGHPRPYGATEDGRRTFAAQRRQRVG
jgi:hypothetical protein